jgi:excisionase family DNA binding protein
MKKMLKPQHTCETAVKSERLLTVASVAVLLGVSQRTVRRWIERDWLPFVRLGPRALRVREATVTAVIEKGIHGVGSDLK